MRIKSRIQGALNLGALGTATLLVGRACEKFNLPATRLLTSKYAQHRLHYRPRTSDLANFQQVFYDREYGCLDDLENVELVIDCGAYVGYSSAYFLNAFPKCQLIAIEPDPDSFLMLKRNLARYRMRAKLVHAAIWPEHTRLVFSDAKFGDGRAWSRHLREAKPEQRTIVKTATISEVFEQSCCPRISVLKIDIEGAEAVLFAKGSGYEKWIDYVDTIAIELHDNSELGNGSAIFLDAIKGRGFQISHSGELTICRRDEKLLTRPGSKMPEHYRSPD